MIYFKIMVELGEGYYVHYMGVPRHFSREGGQNEVMLPLQLVDY